MFASKPRIRLSRPMRAGALGAALVVGWIVVPPVCRALEGVYSRCLHALLPASLWNTHAYDQYLGEGNRRYQAQDYKGAVEAYSRAIRLQPNQPTGYLVRGMAYFRNEQAVQAIADNTQGLTLTDVPIVKADFHYNRAIAYKMRGKWNEAIEDLLASHNLKPDDKGAPRQICECLLQRAYDDQNAGQKSLMLRDALQATQFWPESSEAWMLLGWAQYKQEDYARSIISSREAITLNPLQPYAEFNMGISYAMLGNTQGMRDAYRFALTHADRKTVQWAKDVVQEALKAHPATIALRAANDVLERAMKTVR